jgi:ferric-dicitrate binding protein FerR (iron transport regulator)
MATTIAPVASGVLNLAAPLAKAVTDNGKLTRYARGVVTIGEKRSGRDRVGASGELDHQYRQYEAVP